MMQVLFRLASFTIRALYPWVVMLGAFMLFQVGRGLADNIGPAPIVSPLATADRVLGLGELPSITAQRWQTRGVSDMARAIHLTFFLLPPGSGSPSRCRERALCFRGMPTRSAWPSGWD